MPHVSFRVTEGEKIWMEGYAKLHGMSLSDAVKTAFFKKLEDEYDLRMITAYETGSDKSLVSHEELRRALK